MRHNKKVNHLGRTKAHREAMLANMASSLIKHKRIFTTTAKAKALRKYVEPLITKTKRADVHAQRVAFTSLQDKQAVKILFTEISEKVQDRPGGYTRIIKTGKRIGDNAAMCFIELVDFNENMLKTKTKKAATKTRRSRKKASATDATVVEEKATKEVKATEETKSVEEAKPAAAKKPRAKKTEATEAPNPEAEDKAAE